MASICQAFYTLNMSILKQNIASLSNLCLCFTRLSRQFVEIRFIITTICRATLHYHDNCRDTFHYHDYLSRYASLSRQFVEIRFTITTTCRDTLHYHDNLSRYASLSRQFVEIAYASFDLLNIEIGGREGGSKGSKPMFSCGYSWKVHAKHLNLPV